MTADAPLWSRSATEIAAMGPSRDLSAVEATRAGLDRPAAVNPVRNAVIAPLPEQLPQAALPLLALPGLAVSTGLVGTVPVGVQLVGGRFREDVLLAAGAAIEAGGMPPAPVDPV